MIAKQRDPPNTSAGQSATGVTASPWQRETQNVNKRRCRCVKPFSKIKKNASKNFQAQTQLFPMWLFLNSAMRNQKNLHQPHTNPKSKSYITYTYKTISTLACGTVLQALTWVMQKQFTKILNENPHKNGVALSRVVFPEILITKTEELENAQPHQTPMTINKELQLCKLSCKILKPNGCKKDQPARLAVVQCPADKQTCFGTKRDPPTAIATWSKNNSKPKSELEAGAGTSTGGPRLLSCRYSDWSCQGDRETAW